MKKMVPVWTKMKNRTKDTSKPESIDFFVSLPNEDVYSLRDISVGLFIHQVKSKIELRVGIPCDLIHLYFMNNELADEKTLKEYKVKHGYILRVRIHKTWLGLFLACVKGDGHEVFQNGIRAGIEVDSSTGEFGFDANMWNKLVEKRASFALFMATFHGYLSLMLDILNHSAADINGRTIFGRTPLHVAAFCGHVGCVSLLLSEGADSNALDVFGETPLQLARVNKHVYCQKRLYIHRAFEGTNDVLERSYTTENRTESRPKTTPHEIMRKVDGNPTRKAGSVDKEETGNADPIHLENGLPSIPTPERQTSVTPRKQSPSYNFPEMITKLSHDEVRPRSQATTSLGRTVPVTQSETLCKSIASRGLRGIDAILETAKADVVGEYHNIPESKMDVNLKILSISLPKAENAGNNPEGQRSVVNTDQHGDSREEFRQGRKMLGFVLKEERKKIDLSKIEKDNLSEMDVSTESAEFDGDENHRMEMDKVSSSITDGNLLVRSLHPNRPSEAWKDPEHAQQSSDIKFWTPPNFDHGDWNVTKRKLSSSLSYDAWLEKKQREERGTKPLHIASASRPLSSKVGRQLDQIAFKEWLDSKKKLRKRSKSESASLEIRQNRISSALPFDEWLKQKKQISDSSAVSTTYDDGNEGKTDARQKAINLGGKTFSEWLEEKRRTSYHIFDNVESGKKHIRSHSGKTFRQWLQEKKTEKRNRIISEENLAISKLEKAASLAEQRRLNPRVKTFQEWFEEKRVQRILDFVHSKNSPGNLESSTKLLNSTVKYPEDASLVYGMWLMTKNMEDLRREEILYEEMIQKWRRRELERLQARMNVLNKLDPQMAKKTH